MKTKFRLLILLITTLFISCNNDDSIDTNQDSNFDKGASVNRSFTGVILDTNGNPISGATVTIGSLITQTSSQGTFSILNANVNERFAHIKVTKTGFINGSRVIIPTTGSNRVNIMLIPNTPTAVVNSGVNSTVSLPNGTQVKLDGAFKDASGNPYSGTVNVSLYHLKPSNAYLNEIMPGSLLADNSSNQSRLLETYGMMHVELTGSSGQKLNIVNTAEISLEIDATQTSTPNVIPLWSFDEANGIWKEEGSATKVGNKYVGTVSHFSWWNCDFPLDYCVLNAHVENSVGNPVSNIRIDLIRTTTTSNFRSGITDGNGNVSGLIPANETLTMKVLDNCGTVLSTSSIGPFSSGSTNTIPTIVVNTNTITINGTLQTCSGANVTDGSVTLKRNYGTNFFYNYSTYNVTNGSFSFAISNCSSSAQFKIVGQDNLNLQISQEITFTATAPITNLGFIQTCTSTNEYITYKIDNNPTKTVFTGISCTSQQGFYITSQSTGTSGYFYLGRNSLPVIGTTYNHTTTTCEISDGIFSGFFNSGSTTTMQIIYNQLGAVGGYVDFTMNGTFNDQSGITHTLTATGHVIRDN